MEGQLLTKGICAGNVTQKCYFSKGKIYATLSWPSEITLLTENLFSRADGKDSHYQFGVTGTAPAAAFWSSQLRARPQNKAEKAKSSQILCVSIEPH